MTRRSEGASLLAQGLGFAFYAAVQMEVGCAATSPASGPDAQEVQASAPPHSPSTPVADLPPRSPSTVPTSLPTPGVSRSIGSFQEGSLEGGVPLPLSAPGLAIAAKKGTDRRFGTPALVGALQRAAAHVAQVHPGSLLIVGDLSLREGGPLPGHASHQSGRDVDVYFYLLDARGQPREAKPIPLDPQGRGTDFGDLVDPRDDLEVALDVPRTWDFVETLVLDPEATVQRIFIAEHLRARLLAHARAHGAPEAAMARFGEVTCQPSFPHDDHMHLRIFCGADDIGAGCEDGPPIYPWHAAALAEKGLTPKPMGRRTRPRPALTSHEAAREAAGAMHASVTRFLERRSAWTKQPHPGRKYCR